MANTKHDWPDEWPSPRVPMRIGEAARVLAISKKTLERARQTLHEEVRKDGKLPKGVTKDNAVRAVAKLFEEKAVVLAADIYAALGYTAEKLKELNLPEPKRREPAKKKIKPWQMTDDELTSALKKDAERFNGPLGGPVPYTRMQAIYRELRDGRHITIPGMIKNVPFERALGFKSVADFFRKAGPADCYPFIIPLDQGRPIDLLSSKKKHRRLGDIVFLTIEEWQKKMADAMAVERGKKDAAIEKAELGGGTLEGKRSLKETRKRGV